MAAGSEGGSVTRGCGLSGQKCGSRAREYSPCPGAEKGEEKRPLPAFRKASRPALILFQRDPGWILTYRTVG